jgi:hypothetical protein
MPEPHLVLEVDAADPTYRDLVALAGRLNALLKKPKVLADDSRYSR